TRARRSVDVPPATESTSTTARRWGIAGSVMPGRRSASGRAEGGVASGDGDAVGEAPAPASAATPRSIHPATPAAAAEPTVTNRPRRVVPPGAGPLSARPPPVETGSVIAQPEGVVDLGDVRLR